MVCELAPSGVEFPVRAMSDLRLNMNSLDTINTDAIGNGDHPTARRVLPLPLVPPEPGCDDTQRLHHLHRTKSRSGSDGRVV